MKKRLLIVTPIFPPSIGGPAQYVQKLLEQLPKDISTTVITLAETSGNPHGIIQININTNFIFRQLKLIKTIFTYARDADVVYVQGTLTVGIASMLACLLAGKPYIVKYVGDEVWERYQSKGGKRNLEEYLSSKKQLLENGLLRLEKLVLRRARDVITPGSYLQNILESYFKIKAHDVPNALELRDSTQEKKQKQTIVYVGRLVPWKQLNLLLKAFKMLQNKTNNVWKLTIVGDGEQRENLELQVKTEKITGVHFTGKVSKKDVLDVLKSHEYLVLYSTYEGMSHTLIDGMALGLKIITSDIAPNRALLRDGTYGKLVDVHRWEDLAQSFTQSYEPDMLEKAQKYVLENHTWGRHVVMLQSILFP